MRCLGLDLGSKTLGIAISDRTNIIASVYTTLYFKDENYQSLILPLKDIIAKEEIDTLVLGLPKNMNNTLGFASERSINFKELLEKELDVEVILEDERLSSVEANNALIGSDMSRKKRKGKVDSVAASIILQRYLDRSK